MTDELPVANGFALMLETACRDFETLLKIIRKETVILTADHSTDVRSQAAIQIALAKSFVFYTIRAGRICEHGHQELHISREDRKAFVKSLGPLLAVRDVNEHGFDPTSSGRGKKSRPSLHHHEEDQAITDETAMTVVNSKVLMGPLDLCTFYDTVNRMRSLAGFMALAAQKI